MYTAKKAITTLLEDNKTKLAGSIYIPTNPQSNSQSMSADRTRFKNAIQYIRKHPDYDETELGDSLKKLDKMYEDFEFWKHQRNGLAVLFNAKKVKVFKLPFEVTEAQYLTDHFVVSPLIIMYAVDTDFYVLDLNLTAPRLFHGTQGSLTEIKDSNLPEGLDEEIGKEEYRKHLQHRSSGVGAFHGHSEEDAIDDETRRYLKLVAEAVDAYLIDEHSPLILAGTVSRVGNVRKELNYERILSDSYDGSVERLNANELYDATVGLAQDYFIKRLDASVERLKQAAPEYVAVGGEEIIDISQSERGGRIENLYLPIYRLTKDSVRAGDNTSLVVELPSDIETIEPLVSAVINQGGSIVPVEIDAYKFLDVPKALCRY